MDITPIRTEEDFRAALKEIERLWEAAPGTSEFDRLDVLSTLAEKYEREHHAMMPPSLIDAIKFRMDQLGMRRREELAPILGAVSRISELFSGKRSVTMTQALKLHAWGIPAEVLLTQELASKRRRSEKAASKKTTSKKAGPKRRAPGRQRAKPKSRGSERALV